MREALKMLGADDDPQRRVVSTVYFDTQVALRSPPYPCRSPRLFSLERSSPMPSLTVITANHGNLT